MEHITDELHQIIESFPQKLQALTEVEFAVKPDPLKWSKKEILGHLVDSAQNNLRRFICSQYEGVPPKITYDQDFWVIANDYRTIEKNDVIMLWKLTNHSIIRVLSNISPENYRKQIDTGKHSVVLHDVSFLAKDYVKHMKHHLNQILIGSFNVTYP